MTSAFKVYYDMFNPNATTDFASSSWPMIIGIILTLFGIWMFFSHHTKIGKVSSLIVPFMALAYILLAFIAVLINFEKIPSVIVLIFESAFDFKAILGGFAGSALVIGIKRGLFQMRRAWVLLQMLPLLLLQVTLQNKVLYKRFRF